MSDTITVPRIRTPLEIHELRHEWLREGRMDWEIEDADGYEAHRDELLTWRREIEAEEERVENERLAKRASDLDCSVALVRHIESLERQISDLEHHARGSGNFR